MDVKFNVWKKIADVLMKLVESGEVDAALMPIFGALAPAFLLRIHGKLDIEIDDYMKQKIMENPLVEPILMDAPTLVGATSKVSSDEELDEFLDNEVPKPLAMVTRILMKHLGDEITFSALHPHLGVKGRVHGEEMHYLIRNGIKYYK